VKVIIGARTFAITESAEGFDAEDYGEFHPDHGIQIAPGLSPDAAATTVLHEIVHAIAHVYALPDVLDEESMCGRLEAPLLAFLRDNPTLVRHLTASAKGRPFPFGSPK
jgi:hypothetical protein